MQTFALDSLMSLKKGNTTLNDIAKALNVTPSTVSRALNNHPSISESTRKAVIAAASRLNYRPNRIAAALRKGKSHIIGVIVSAADRSFFGSIIRGIEEELNQAGYSIIVCQTYEDKEYEERALDTLVRTRVDGIISTIAKNTTDLRHYERVKSQGIPLILFDNTVDSLGVSTVTIDDYNGAYQATSHLIQQGCRRIVHLAGKQNNTIYRERLRGYTSALEYHGIAVDESRIISCPSDVEEGKKAALRMLAGPELPDGIFSSSDWAALGVLQIFKSHRIRVPEDVGMIGFSNEPFTSYIEPALSTVDQHSKRIGQFAARIFLEEADSPHIIPRQTILKPELIIRASSQKPIVNALR